MLNLNMKDAEGYVKLIKMAEPKFITLKGYTWLGGSKKRLAISNMPSMKEIEDFTESIASNLTNYKTKLRDKISRVIIIEKTKLI